MKGEKTIIVGLGNTILSDDGVGIYIARELEEKLLNNQKVDVIEASLAGFNLVEMLQGYSRAIIIDSIMTADGEVGDVYHFSPEAVSTTVRLASVHDINLITSLKLYRELNLPVPETVDIYAVEVADNSTFHQGCCPEVEKAMPEVITQVLQQINSDFN